MRVLVDTNVIIDVLQNRQPWLRLSISRNIVAPVVEKPDMVSKNASVKLVIAPLK